MKFDRGYITPYFVTDSEKMAVEYENCKLLIVDNKITNARGLINILEGALRGGYPVLIIAEDIELEALATLVVNKLGGSPKIAALKAPGFGDCKSQYLDDIAILTGGTVIREEVGHTLDNVGKEVLGHASKVVLTKYTSTTVGHGSTQEAVNKRVAQIKNLIEAAEQDYVKEKLSERIAKLSGVVAVIRVGAQTETELKEKKLRAEDVLNTTMTVVEEGIVVGGECILLRLASKVDAIKNALHNDEEKVLPSDKFKYGYNAATGNYDGLMAAGITDPTKYAMVHKQAIPLRPRIFSVVNLPLMPRILSVQNLLGHSSTSVMQTQAMSSQKILCRSYAIARFMDCYEARAEGLLKDEVVRFCRDIICSCLNRLERGIMHASFDLSTITHNGVSYSLSHHSYSRSRTKRRFIYIVTGSVGF